MKMNESSMWAVIGGLAIVCGTIGMIFNKSNEKEVEIARINLAIAQYTQK